MSPHPWNSRPRREYGAVAGRLRHYLASLGTAQKVSTAAGLYGGSWVFFALAIAAMGKDGYEALKKRFTNRLEAPRRGLSRTALRRRPEIRARG